MEKYIIAARFRDTSTKCYRSFAAYESKVSPYGEAVVDKTIFANGLDDAKDMVVAVSKWMLDVHVPDYGGKNWLSRLFVRSIPDSCVKYELSENGLASTCHCKNGSVVFVQAMKIED